VGMKLDVAVLPVADAERVKDFCGRFGWRLAHASFSDSGFRVVRFTPPGPGGGELTTRGAEVSEVFHAATPGTQFQPDGTSGRVSGPAPDHGGYRSFAAYIGAEQARTELPT